MARFIVTSGSHFQPLTYDELVKPLMQMTEAQNKAQDAYDQISMETNALENYISQNPEDERARAMYDNYKSKLTALQNNLWNNGYSGQTARDLSAARAGYAGDITRLATAIKNRQDRSKEYWDLRHKNPDMVAGNDPGAAGLDNYLDNDRYGQDYFNYSGDKFTTEVATDAKAIAGAKLESEIVKDPKLKGYLERIKTEGYTMEEADHATSAVEDLLFNGNSDALNNLTYPERLLAETLVSHMNSTGAERYTYDDNGNVIGGNLSEEEYRRLFEYGKAGAKHAVGKTSIDDIKDQEYAYKQEINKINYQHALNEQEKDAEFTRKLALEAMKSGDSSLAAQILGGNFGGTTNIEDMSSDERKKLRAKINPLSGHDTQIAGDPKKAQKQLEDWFGKDTLMLVGGKEIHNGADASDLVYQHDYRSAVAQPNMIGLDVGRTPTKSEKDRVMGEVYDKSGNLLDVQVIPVNGQYYVQTRPKGNYASIEDGWTNQPTLTNKYREARKEYEKRRDAYKVNNPDVYKIAKIDPDKQYDMYSSNRIHDRFMPLSKFASEYASLPQNSINSGVHYEYVALGTTKDLDGGNKIGDLNGLLSQTIHEGDNKRRDWKEYKGQYGHIHEYNAATDSPDNKSIIKPNDIFTFKDHIINNINAIQLTEDGLRNGYLLIKVFDSDKTYTIGADMLNSNTIKDIFDQSRKDIENIHNDPHLSASAKREEILDTEASAAANLRAALGITLHTQKQSDTYNNDSLSW